SQNALVRRLLNLPVDPLRHQMVTPVLVSEFRVELLRCRVVPGHFEMDSVHSKRTGGFLDEIHGAAPPSLTAMTFEQKEFVNEGIAAQQFQAVAEGRDDVT